MQWSEIKDLLLLKEVAATGVFTYKQGSRERGNSWQLVAKNLNAFEGFIVTNRAVRDRITHLMKKFSAQNNADLKSTGTSSPEPSESDILLQNLIDIQADTEIRVTEENAEKNAKANVEIQKALDIRATAMETHKETRKRKNDEEGEEKSSKARRSSTETLSFLMKKLDSDRELKNRELECNKFNQNNFQQMMLQQQQQSNNMLQMFAQQSQTQSEQFQAMIRPPTAFVLILL